MHLFVLHSGNKNILLADFAERGAAAGRPGRSTVTPASAPARNMPGP